MGSGAFLKVVFKNFDVLAGPVVTLVYPLYASVKAIETKSPVDDQQWLTYWVLYSFITLFELTFAKVLEWIPFWSYAKLMLSCWLVLPYFNGAAYVYQHFVRPLFVNHQTVNVWYVPGKKDTFDKPDDLLSAAERYIEENGPEAFEKLISKISFGGCNVFWTFLSHFIDILLGPEYHLPSSLKEHLNLGASVPFWRRRKPWECLMLKENLNPGAKTTRSLIKIIDTES